MANLKWKELLKALFLSGIVGCLSVAVSGSYWVGIPALAFSAWLFYCFYDKMAILKRVFAGELPQDVKAGFAYFKMMVWDNNHAKIYLLIVAPIILFLGWLLSLSLILLPGQDALLMKITCVYVLIFSLLGLYFFADESKISDKNIGKAIVQLPKFILKVPVLTVYRAHSIESFAVSLYSLSGMIYIFIFPPFQLAPTVIFLMAGGCGIFTGLCGLVINKVLSIALLQRAFARVEAW